MESQNLPQQPPSPVLAIPHTTTVPQEPTAALLSSHNACLASASCPSWAHLSRGGSRQLERDRLQLLVPAEMTTLRLHKELWVAQHKELGSVVTVLVLSCTDHREHTWASPEPGEQPLPWPQLPSCSAFTRIASLEGFKLQQDVLSPALT